MSGSPNNYGVKSLKTGIPGDTAGLAITGFCLCLDSGLHYDVPAGQERSYAMTSC